MKKKSNITKPSLKGAIKPRNLKIFNQEGQIVMKMILRSKR